MVNRLFFDFLKKRLVSFCFFKSPKRVFYDPLKMGAIAYLMAKRLFFDFLKKRYSIKFSKFTPLRFPKNGGYSLPHGKTSFF